MAHLSNFGVGNFRAFKDTYNFEFAPITVLTGTNSSGKSSLIKAILLLKESIKDLGDSNSSRLSEWSMKSLMQLKFNPSLHLGNFDTVKNYTNSSAEVVFELPFRLPSCKELLKLKLSYRNDKMEKNNGALFSMQLITPDNQTCLIDVTESRGGFKRNVDYKALWNLLLQNSIEIEEISGLRNTLTETLEQYNLSVNELDNENLPIKVMHAREEFLKAIDRRPFLNGFQTFNTTSLASTCIYYSEVESQIGEEVKFYNSTLLNYLFIYPQKYVEENISKWYNDLSEEEIGILLFDLHEVNVELEKLKKNGQSILDVVRDLEFTTLSKEEQFGNPYTDSKKEKEDFTEAISELNEKMKLSYTSIDGKFSLLRANKGSLRGSRLAEAIQDSGTSLSKILSNELFIIDKVPRGVKYPDLSVGKFFFERFLYEGLVGMFSTLSKVFEKIDYVPSVRTKIERFYKNTPTESFLQECIDKLQSEKMEPDALIFFEKWVNQLGIADKVNLAISSDSAATRIELIKGGKTIQLADVGYGYAQLLPILLRITMCINREMLHRNIFIESIGDFEIEKTGFNPSLLIIEEPETNLHPALQSKLADMFVECYQNYNIQFIIETHSEYLIRRLQRRTAEFYNPKKKNDLSIPTDFTQIYYFYPPDNVPEGEKQIYPINIQNDGALTKNFGTGFFDEAGNEDLLLYQIAKHNKN